MVRVVCFSGGHSSAIAAIEAVRRYGRENVVLLNHDISSKVEHQDIKRFKEEVADALKVPIRFANAPNFEEMTPLKISVKNGAFNVGTQSAQICTSRLKTEPFNDYLKKEFPTKDCSIIYGFDASEPHRITRRSQMLGMQGFKTEFPLIWGERTIKNTEELGIKKPVTYQIFRHANCQGCLKAGQQHWYIIYCMRPDIFDEAIWAEDKIGHSILKDAYMKNLVEKFEEIKAKGICPSEKGNSATFWAKVNSVIPGQQSFLPCDCAI